jgi:hypothetical protein
MRIRLALALLLPALVAAPAFADSTPEPGTQVEMPYLIAPMVIEERLVAYAYISSKVVAASPSAAILIRDRLAFIQDAYVRDVNGMPIAKADDPKTVDMPGLTARLLADARRIVGQDKVSSVEIIRVQFAPLKEGEQTEPAAAE